MKRLVAFATVAALAMAGTAATAAKDNHHIQNHPTIRTCDVEAFDIWAGKVWDQARWRRGAPPHKVRAAQRRQLHCQPLSARHRMQDFWREVKHDYNVTRKSRLWSAKYRQFEYPDGSHWAVPYPIAWCESGGDYYVGPSGAYGLIPPFEQWMPPREQDEVAYNLYLEQGDGPWAPYESGCGYR